MKTSKVFKIAKQYLSVGAPHDTKVPYICYAIQKAEQDKKITVRDQNRTEKIISDLLGDECHTLSIWLARNHHIKWWERFGGNEKIQITRHAWLDHLIKHYESLGD